MRLSPFFRVSRPHHNTKRSTTQYTVYAIHLVSQRRIETVLDLFDDSFLRILQF